jgi:hypothetical protein
MCRGAHHGAELGQKHVGAGEREAHGAEAERGVHLRRHLEGRDELVASDVEGAQRGRPRVHRFEHRAIDFVLLVFVGRCGTVDVEKLGPIKTNPLRAMIDCQRRLGRKLDIRAQVNGDAVGRRRLLVAIFAQVPNERDVLF